MSQLESFEFQRCRFAYRVDGAGPPLVMIQGVGAHGSVLNPLIEQLFDHYTCLSFDNRGIGASQPPGKDLSAQQMADDVFALMDHLGWDSAHLVGHSFGGLIALQAALTNKRRVRSLSLLCSFANGAHASRPSVRLFWILSRLRFGPQELRRQAFMELVLPPGHPEIHSPALAALLSKIVGHDIAETPKIASEQVRIMRHTDLASRLGQLAGIPTLVINGDKDMIAPPSLGRALAARIPRARFVEIPGAAHSFPILEPQRCAALLLEHIAGAEKLAGHQPIDAPQSQTVAEGL